MQAAVKGLPRPDQDVGSRTGAAQGLICPTTTPALRGDIIRNHDHQVIIAVRTSIASGLRAEQIDALRLEGLDEAVQNLTQHRIVSLQVPSPTNYKIEPEK